MQSNADVDQIHFKTTIFTMSEVQAARLVLRFSLMRAVNCLYSKKTIGWLARLLSLFVEFFTAFKTGKHALLPKI